MRESGIADYWHGTLPAASLTWSVQVRAADGCGWLWSILDEHGNTRRTSSGERYSHPDEAMSAAYRSYFNDWESFLPDSAAAAAH